MKKNTTHRIISTLKTDILSPNEFIASVNARPLPSLIIFFNRQPVTREISNLYTRIFIYNPTLDI